MAVEKATPFDLDAFVAEGEAASKDFEFIFGGERYTLPSKPSILAVLDLDNGKYQSGLRRLLGGDQWARLEASDAVFDVDKMNGLLTEYQRHLGTAPGESQASLVSSKRTATRSRQTSRGTTKSR